MERILRFGRLAVLFDPDRLAAPEPGWFDPAWWAARDAIRHRFGGRGAALAVDGPAGPAVLRTYLRGGLVRHVVRSRYAWTGTNRTRSFREWRVTRALFDAGLPVPEPLAGAFSRAGPCYRAALLTRHLESTDPLSQVADRLDRTDWQRLDSLIERFATAGLEHPDLNATNVLVGANGEFWLIDFDRARLLPKPIGAGPMIRRLERSLNKLALDHVRRR